MKYVMNDNWELVPVEDKVINESKRRKRKRPVGGYFVTYTTGYPNHDMHMFNVHNGTDFPKEEQESAEAANEVSSKLAGGSAEAGIGGSSEATGSSDGAVSGDGGASAGGEGGGCCEDLTTNKDETELQESSSLSAEEKMILFNRGERRENVRACSDEKLALY